MTATTTHVRRRAALLVAAMIAVAATLALWPVRERVSMPTAAAPVRDGVSDPIAMGPALQLDGQGRVERLPVPTFGAEEQPFVRQRHDYPPDTPERLGAKVGRVLFDLETVVDEVSRAHEPGSRVALVLGAPVDEEAHARAQQALQKFFDEATPIVDAALAGDASLDLTFERLLAMREGLNCDLMVSLGMFEEELFHLWPQMEGVLPAACRNPRPVDKVVIPRGMDLRGGDDSTGSKP